MGRQIGTTIQANAALQSELVGGRDWVGRRGRKKFFVLCGGNGKLLFEKLGGVACVGENVII